MSESASGKASSANGAEDNNSCECPTCGRDDFKNKSGRNQHHAVVHGESIAKEIYTCAHCGTGFERLPSQVNDQKFCSQECMGEWNSENRTGVDSPNWQGGKAVLECEICGEEYKVKKNKTSWSRFCSLRCRNENASLRWRGESNPRWKPTEHPTYYGPNWIEQRDKALKRDQYRCQACGATEATLPRRPDVHHIQPIASFKERFENPEWWMHGNKLANLVAFCRPCHMEWEGIPLRPQ